ncbi:hypothetical protein D3C76_933380 [compost metagenome]
MTALINHPFAKFLFDREQVAKPLRPQVHINHEELEQLMIKEDNRFTGTISQVRIVERGDTGIEIKPAEGNLTSRIFSLVEATRGCKLQSEFQDKVIDHPAFALIRDELREAANNGNLNQKFDLIEATGATLTFEKFRGLVSIGLNEPKMRAAIRERTKMVDLANRTLINRANGVTSYDIFKEPRDTPVEKVEMSTSFFVSFAV